jgi:Protein of unknown function (DUF4235)
MTRIMFVPFSALAGLLAGRIHKRAFAWLWALVDDERAPDPSLAGVPLVKVVGARALDGAVAGATAAIVDRASRETFRWLTGRWPGKETPAADG